MLLHRRRVCFRHGRRSIRRPAAVAPDGDCQITIPSSASSAADPLHNLVMPLAAARKTVPGPYLRLIDGHREPMEKKVAAPLDYFTDWIMGDIFMALARDQVTISSARRSVIRHRLRRDLEREFGVWEEE